MENFKKKNLLELRQMRLAQLEQYHKELRKYEYENGIPLTGIQFRQAIHKPLLELIKLDRLISGEELYIIGDKREKTNKPVIYAATHIGGNDIQRIFEAINDHAYLFLGDPKETYIDATGILLDLNGVIRLETDDKVDRAIGYNRAVELIKKGGSLLIFPEGAWNIIENLLVLKLYNGTVRMANETEVDIIPMAIEQYANRFFVNIGKNIPYDPEKSGDIIAMNDLLRDTLATLKWDIWERIGDSTRASITKDEITKFRESIVARCGYGYTIEDVYKTMYHDKRVTSPEIAYPIAPEVSFHLLEGNFEEAKRLFNEIEARKRAIASINVKNTETSNQLITSDIPLSRVRKL